MRKGLYMYQFANIYLVMILPRNKVKQEVSKHEVGIGII